MAIYNWELLRKQFEGDSAPEQSFDWGAIRAKFEGTPDDSTIVDTMPQGKPIPASVKVKPILRSVSEPGTFDWDSIKSKFESGKSADAGNGVLAKRPSAVYLPLQDEWEQMNKFQKGLDIIGRPGYAVKAALAQRQQTNLVGQSPNLAAELAAAGRGLMGNERHTANELFANVGISGVPGLGFVGEVITDPLMLIAGPITKGVGAVAKVAGRGAVAIPGVGEGIAAIANKLEPITAALKKAFISKTGNATLDTLVNKLMMAREGGENRAIEYGVKVQRVINNIAKQTGKKADEISMEVVNAIEKPGSAVSHNSVNTLANSVKSKLETLLAQEQKAGLPITDFSVNQYKRIQEMKKAIAEMPDNAERIKAIEELRKFRETAPTGYVPRITTGEAREYLKNAQVGGANIWSTKLDAALRRKTGDFTMEEFNQFAKANGLPALGGRTVEEFFIKNPAVSTAIRSKASVKAVTSAQFLDEAGKLFGREATEPGVELAESVTKLNSSLSGKKFDPIVAEEINRASEKYLNPGQLSPIGEAFDKVQNFWKRWTLMVFPKYHLRNVAGNMWNNYLADVRPESYEVSSLLQMYNATKAGGKARAAVQSGLKSLGVTPETADSLLQRAKDTGAIGQGQYGADIERKIEAAIKGSKSPTGIGMAVGKTLEDNARLAHFVDRINRGDDAMTAALSVKKYLFDYNDLTSFEKQVMKRIFPFYTWTRKNIPLQLEQMVTKPGKFVPVTEALRNRQTQNLEQLKLARPDLYERLPIEIRRDLNSVTYVPLEGVLPAADVSKLARPKEMAGEMLSPYIKWPLEQMFDKSLYTEQELERYRNETGEVLRLDIPVRLKHTLLTVLPWARLVNEVNRVVRKQVAHEELTLQEQAIQQTLSVVYKMPLTDLAVKSQMKLERDKRDLMMGFKWAMKQGRVSEMQRIMKTMGELGIDYNKIQGGAQ